MCNFSGFKLPKSRLLETTTIPRQMWRTRGVHSLKIGDGDAWPHWPHFFNVLSPIDPLFDMLLPTDPLFDMLSPNDPISALVFRLRRIFAPSALTLALRAHSLVFREESSPWQRLIEQGVYTILWNRDCVGVQTTDHGVPLLFRKKKNHKTKQNKKQTNKQNCDF